MLKGRIKLIHQPKYLNKDIGLLIKREKSQLKRTQINLRRSLLTKIIIKTLNKKNKLVIASLALIIQFHTCKLLVKLMKTKTGEDIKDKKASIKIKLIKRTKSISTGQYLHKRNFQIGRMMISRWSKTYIIQMMKIKMILIMMKILMKH